MILVLVHTPDVLSHYQLVYQLTKAFAAETSCAIRFFYYEKTQFEIFPISAHTQQ